MTRALIATAAGATAAAAALMLASRPSAHAQNQAKEVVITTTKVRGNVAMLEGRGGNIGVVYGDEGALIVDDQFAPLAAKIKAAVGALGKGPIRFVANTHWHHDHVGGNENMASDGAVIVAHDNVRKRMSVEQFNATFNRKAPASPAKALPVVTFAREVTFHFAGEEVEALHLEKAHTDGDVVYRFKKANVLHTGDLFVNGKYPYIDFDSGGSLDGMIAAQQRILDLIDAETKVIPGHGALGDKAALQAAHDTLKTARDRIEKLLESGKTPEQIRAAKPLADLDATWAGPFITSERMLAMMLRGLGAK